MRLTIYSTMSGSTWGGSEELWYAVALKLLQANCTVQVCVKSWGQESDKIKKLENNGAYIIRRNEIKGDIKKRFFGSLYGNTYIKKIRDFKPSAVLISQGGTFDFFHHKGLIKLMSELNAPFFLISQFNTETGNIIPNGIKNTIAELNNKWQKFYFVSERNYRVAERQCALHLKNVQIVSNPVNIKDVTKAPWPVSRKLKLCCMARYDCSYKGQDILIQCLAENEFANYDYELNFFGEGPHKQYLKELVNFYKLGSRIFIQGHVNDIDEVWVQHHALILPSIVEGTPLVLQECMLKGRPALVTDVGGCAELVRENETGFIAASASVNSLKEKLVTLFNLSFDRLKEMGECAHAKAHSAISFYSASEIFSDLMRASQN